MCCIFVMHFCSICMFVLPSVVLCQHITKEGFDEKLRRFKDILKMFVTREGQVKLKKSDNVARREISRSLCTSDVMFLSLSFFKQ